MIKLDEQDTKEAEEFLKYCVDKKYEIVALTNWFKEAQIKKLQKVNLYEYFDEIYAGDDF